MRRRPRLTDEVVLGLLEVVSYVQDDLAAGMRFSNDEEKDQEFEERYYRTSKYVEDLLEWWKEKKEKERARSGQQILNDD